MVVDVDREARLSSIALSPTLVWTQQSVAIPPRKSATDSRECVAGMDENDDRLQRSSQDVRGSDGGKSSAPRR